MNLHMPNTVPLLGKVMDRSAPIVGYMLQSLVPKRVNATPYATMCVIGPLTLHHHV